MGPLDPVESGDRQVRFAQGGTGHGECVDGVALARMPRRSRAQRAAILAEAERRGWNEVEFVDDAGYSGRSLKRPGIEAALDALKRKKADTLVVAKVDRLSRSLVDFADLMDRSAKEGWALVALDLGVDMTTPTGAMVANVMATFAQFERRLIGQRTKEALAAKRAANLGMRIGRTPEVPAEVIERIRAEHKSEASYAKIADRLNEDGVATAQGGLGRAPWTNLDRSRAWTVAAERGACDWGSRGR